MESDALSTKKFRRQRALLELFAGVLRPMSVAVLREFRADSRMEPRRTRKAHLAPSRHQFGLGALSELSASLTNCGPGVVLSAVAAHPSQPDPMDSISR